MAFRSKMGQMINEPYHHLSVHIYSSKKDVCITLLIATESNQGQPDDTTSADGVWQENEIWSCFCSHFCCWAAEIILLFLVCVTTLLSQGRTGSKICSALYHSTTMECMCMWDEKKSKKYTNKHIPLYLITKKSKWEERKSLPKV